MNTSEYSETQKIELATAEAFFGLYNTKHGTTYSVDRVAGPREVPDIFASDSDGREFNLEITLTEDRPGNIAALLGRSGSLSIEKMKRENEAVRAGKAQPRINSLQGNVLPVLLDRTGKKLTKRYGTNTALVVRDTSFWEWEFVIPSIQAHLNSKVVPFDLGIWLLTAEKTAVFQLYAPKSAE
jgi:hypothetical protein